MSTPLKMKHIGVVGCGLMGAGIAQVCAEAGYQVLVREVNDDLPFQRFLATIVAFASRLART